MALSLRNCLVSAAGSLRKPPPFLFFVCSENLVQKCNLGVRYASSSHVKTELKPAEGKICAWQIHSYGGIEELQFSCSVREPIISQPDDVIVNVSACSVNPLDVNMMGGYGSTLLNAMRKTQSKSMEDVEFPLTLGRDFAGIVSDVGHGVNNLRPGDQVWGVLPPHDQGCHAQKVVVHQSYVRQKPKRLSMEEASSILYTAVTAWSALRITGDLLLGARGKRILVIGAAGGVGSSAVQLSRAWGAEVVGVCRTDAVPFVEALGANYVLDYCQPDFVRRLQQEKRFDVILDAAGLGADNGQYTTCLKEWSNAKYITLRSPLLKNMDEHGLVIGALRSAADLLQPNLTSGALQRGASMRWGFFIPCDTAIDEIQLLVESDKVVPGVQKVYPFQEMPAAFQHVQGGHLRGKVVISLE